MANLNFIKKFIPEFVKKPFRDQQTIKGFHSVWRSKDNSDWPVQTDTNSKLSNYEYALFSQNGEDGILRYIFSEIGYESRYFLEFGFGPTESNSLRLVLHENFNGVFIDGSLSSVDGFNAAAKSWGLTNVKAVHKFLDRENLEPTIIESGLPSEIDLLSIDVDGNDYWFWESINYLNPRVVVIEYNASMGPDLSVTVPYDPNFERFKHRSKGFYAGASINALSKLGASKGYALVGSESSGVNLFFVRRDCLTENLVEREPSLAFKPHNDRVSRGFSQEEQFDTIKGMEFVDI